MGFLQQALKQSETVVDSGAQGGLQSAQDLRHLVVAKLLRVPQKDGLPDLLGKTRQSITDTASPLLDQKPVDLLRRGRVRAVGGRLQRVVLCDALASNVIATAISRRRD
jgi:hypothetical protein